ncbi:hypothetical protein EJ04DRAFT_183978 [Polyplosphaeria fusca]|uniref:Uncharacterized protein n=1 Tax=Polyplosphaeria fusca TaxID=682080 RepID=A0A9P4QXI4_9PLEO|nr:hypothetical protein EJ04DRAFT_183978 [Polyplosphaeria fusca]
MQLQTRIGSQQAENIQRATFNNQCDDSDGANFCECQLLHGKIDRCMYYGRQTEPLAWIIEDEPVLRQDKSPLFALIPTEVRDAIYAYAFTDCTSNPPDWDNPYRDNPYRREEGDNRVDLPRSDIAVNLLCTCRAVYMEAYQLPILLNPFNVYKFGNLPSYDICRPRFVTLAPWQFALIQGLDISLQQVALEGDKLGKYLTIWRAKERHDGAIIAPRFYQESRSLRPGKVIPSFNFRVLPYLRSRSSTSLHGLGVQLGVKSTFYSRNQNESPLMQQGRAMIARPLTHLTLRLSRTDWWTWSDHSDDPMRHLGLDPAAGDGDVGDKMRPTAPRMMQLAAERRAGSWPGQSKSDEPLPRRYTSSWGAQIAKLPDLKTLELVLETFSDKKSQLDTVIDCAKTWAFPLDNQKYELVWDGKVEMKSYQGEQGSLQTYDATRASHARHVQNPTGAQGSSSQHDPGTRRYEVRIIRYRRTRSQ